MAHMVRAEWKTHWIVLDFSKDGGSIFLKSSIGSDTQRVVRAILPQDLRPTSKRAGVDAVPR